MSDAGLEQAVAIVGMAGRFPGAGDVDTFWDNVRNGVESIRQLSDEELEAAGVDAKTRNDPGYVKAAGVLDDVAMFDAGYFGVSPKDAAIMDPQHRHFLECAVTALEHAGHTPQAFSGPIGVFAGCGMNAYFMRNLVSNPELMRDVGLFLLRHTGNDRDFLPTTVSYKLNLTGPSIAVQTACSTSLVAVHTACQSILAGECDMALAGGSTIMIPHGQGYYYRENEPFSPDGHCRPFDVQSKGTVVSSGVGVVVLRVLADAIEDGDTIHAVIRGSAINNDGAGKIGYLAPSVGGHAEVVTEALALAGVTADTIDYVEAHGTATPVGDPIEVTALTQAFRQTSERNQYCRIGSVKSNIGHLDTAAGVASLIKVSKALQSEEFPPSLHYTAPNPEIDFSSTPFVVSADLQPWPRDTTPRRAGVSSLGIGGTNAHVIVEQAPQRPPSEPAARPWQVLPVSAKSKASLAASTDNLSGWLNANENVELADAAFTLQEGREAREHRTIVVAESHRAAADAIEQGDQLRVYSGRYERDVRGVVFLFSGGGSQYPNMGRDLYETEPVYRRELDRCLDAARGKVDYDLKACLYPEPEDEERARVDLALASRLCPAIFATEWAMAQLWRSWGIEPSAMIGHSLGEYVAATMAGVLSLEDAMHLVTLRGNLIDTLSGGAMLSLPMSEDEAREALGDELDLAAVNSPSLCVASGRFEQVDEFRQRLAGQDIEARLIPINAPGHSRHLDPILDEFRRGVQDTRLSSPQIPYVSNVTGTWVRDEDVCDPDYWVRHLRGTVRFSAGLAEILADTDRALLEVGPGQTLCGFARQQPTKALGIVPSFRRSEDDISDDQAAAAAFGRLWIAGVAVDWSALRGEAARQRIPMPTYPFEHQPYWIEPVATAEVESRLRLDKIPAIEDWFQRPTWRRAPLDEAPAGEPETWLVFLDAAGIGSSVADRLRARGDTVVTVRYGDAFYRFDDHDYALAPEAGRIGYDELVRALADKELLPDRIVHLWTVTPDESFRPGSSFLHRNQECGFYSLVFLAQALGEAAEEFPHRLTVVSNGMQAVAGEESLMHPDKATVLGPVRVIPHEYPDVFAQSIDIELPHTERSGLFRRGASGSDLGAAVDAVMSELGSDGSDGIVAWRDGVRYCQELAAARPGAEETTRLREGGVYLITGGLGGIGFALAQQLAGKYKAKLALVSRGALPPESQWDDWLASHGAGDRTSEQIKAIVELRNRGSEVLVAAADVADVERMRDVVATTVERFGALHGVLHAAGKLEDEVIAVKTQESAERVFTAKLHGSLLLDKVLEDTEIDFLALFSSTSALLGPPGQVDYAAANAFLNAFAEQRTRNGRYTTAIGWGVWNEVGEAKELSAGLRGVARSESSVRLTKHPLLGNCVAEGPDEWRWVANWRADELWILDDHRTREHLAVLPGTGYLEMARAAYADAIGDEPIDILDATFLSPLSVRDQLEHPVQTILKKQDGGWAFEVAGRDGEDSYMIAMLRVADSECTAPVDLDAAETRCTSDCQEASNGETLPTSQEHQLAFGPRWAMMRSIRFGTDEVVARLELNAEFGGDLAEFALHPAMLDVATGCALPLIHGWQADDHLYVPMAYERVRVNAPLSRTVVSNVRSSSSNRSDRESVSFDVSICNEAGDVLVEIDGYQMRKLDANAAFGSANGAALAAGTPSHYDATPVEEVFLETFEAGILLEEGVQALELALAADTGGALLVSSIDLADWQQRLDQASAKGTETPTVKFARPELDSEYAAPRDSIEQSLVEFWEELLGVDQIGIHDDFFELGGHSLIAVRLFAKIKKQWGVDRPISVLFDAATVDTLGEVVRDEVGPVDESGEAQPRKRGPSHRFLVPMNKIEGADKTPFFIVAGMFGNVLNLRHLAAHLGKDQPVYALQAKGLYGDDEPHRTFEDMASDYLAEIRDVQPQGPYLLGGFSGGGVTAFEMAHQLAARGESVAAMIMLDALPPPPAWPQVSQRDELVIHAQLLARQGPAYLWNRVRNRIRWEMEKRDRRRHPPREELTPAEFRSEQIEVAFREALSRYSMRELSCPIRLYRPPLDCAHDLGRGRTANSARELIDPDNWWGPWVDGVEVQEVPGNHDSMVLEPNVRVLAKHVGAALEDVQRDLKRAAPVEVDADSDPARVPAKVGMAGS